MIQRQTAGALAIRCLPRGSLFSVAVVKDKFYVIGGQIAAENSDSYIYKSENEQYTPIGYENSEPSPSQEPTPFPTPTPEGESFATTLVIASVSIVALVGLGLLVFFKKRKR